MATTRSQTRIINQLKPIIDLSNDTPYEVKRNVTRISRLYNLPQEWCLIQFKGDFEREYINFIKYDEILKSPNRGFVDIGFMYDGMGWVNFVSWDIKRRQAFLRLDGGASGIDVEMCANYYNNVFNLDTHGIRFFNFGDLLFQLYTISLNDDEYRTEVRRFYNENRVHP